MSEKSCNNCKFELGGKCEFLWTCIMRNKWLPKQPHPIGLLDLAVVIAAQSCDWPRDLDKGQAMQIAESIQSYTIDQSAKIEKLTERNNYLAKKCRESDESIEDLRKEIDRLKAELGNQISDGHNMLINMTCLQTANAKLLEALKIARGWMQFSPKEDDDFVDSVLNKYEGQING